MISEDFCYFLVLWLWTTGPCQPQSPAASLPEWPLHLCSWARRWYSWLPWQQQDVVPMVMVGSSRKTAEVLVIWWLHTHPPPAPAAVQMRVAPTASPLCKMVTADAIVFLKCHSCLFEDQTVWGCLLPQEKEPAFLQGSLSCSGGISRTLSSADSIWGELFQKRPFNWLPAENCLLFQGFVY